MAVGDEYRALMEQDMGAANGVATLDESARLSEAQWPEPLGLLENVTGDVQAQLDEKAKGASVSSTTPAAAGWYRIAKSIMNVSNCSGLFSVAVTASHGTTAAIIGATTSFAKNVDVSVHYCTHGVDKGVSKARIVYPNEYSGNYAFLELYAPKDTTTSRMISVNVLGNHSWSLVAPSTPGEIPDGYTSVEVELMNGGKSVESHRTTFRGQNLGTSLTDAQLAAIKAGTFDNLYLGDYWVINGVNWRIADFDYWYRCGDTSFTNHHLVIIPDTALYTAQMNATNTTEGGYVGSLMYTENLEQAKTAFRDAFGDALLTHREYLVNAVTDGRPSAGAWFDSTVELPNEIMIYGSHVFTPANDGSTVPALYTIGNSQLALMQACPKFIKRRYTYWLRDVVSASHFVYVSGHGNTSYSGMLGSHGVRPVAAIG